MLTTVTLSETLSSQEDGVYTVLDGASVEELRSQLNRLAPPHVCLYRGDLAPDLAEVAPYLVELLPGSAFTNWLIREGWGRHWGVFAMSDRNLLAMRKHFRRLLTVHGENGKPLLFRYYDPRVLRAFLPLCDDTEAAEMFGPVRRYVVEGETSQEALVFEWKRSGLSRHSVVVDQYAASEGIHGRL